MGWKAGALASHRWGGAQGTTRRARPPTLYTESKDSVVRFGLQSFARCAVVRALQRIPQFEDVGSVVADDVRLRLSPTLGEPFVPRVREAYDEPARADLKPLGEIGGP